MSFWLGASTGGPTCQLRQTFMVSIGTSRASPELYALPLQRGEQYKKRASHCETLAIRRVIAVLCVARQMRAITNRHFSSV